jgi:hypothetical protein
MASTTSDLDLVAFQTKPRTLWMVQPLNEEGVRLPPTSQTAGVWDLIHSQTACATQPPRLKLPTALSRVPDSCTASWLSLHPCASNSGTCVTFARYIVTLHPKHRFPRKGLPSYPCPSLVPPSCSWPEHIAEIGPSFGMASDNSGRCLMVHQPLTLALA